MRKCYKGIRHVKHQGCVHVDASSNGYSINRYLFFYSYTPYDYWSGKALKTTGYFKIQWKNLRNDLNNLFRNPILLPRIALSLTSFLFFWDHHIAQTIAFMGAVAFDNKTTYDSGTTNNTSHSWTHTVNSATNGVLVVGVSPYQSNSAPVTATYNSVSMNAYYTDALNATIDVFNLTGPSSGANSVAITCANSVAIRGGSVSVTGSNGTLQNNAVSANTGATLTVTVTSSTNNLVCDFWGTQFNVSKTLSADGSQTVDANIFTVSSGVDETGIQMSHKAGAASVVMTWTTSSGNINYDGIGVDIVASTTSTPHRLASMGVGR